ncbi:MAG: type II toxin-antitoxin system HicA family toxin [Bacteroidota bacterium]
MPSDFHYNEVVKLLGYFGFKELNRGKTSGSRVKFINDQGIPIMLHRPHPSGIMKQYQLKQIKEVLGL